MSWGLDLGLGLNLTRRGGSWGAAAYAALAGLANGFVLDPLDDFVLVRDASTPANNFTGTMAQAVDRGILVNASPPTKWLLNSSGILTSGSNLRCQYSAAGVPLGFLPEPQRTRLNTYPTQFDNAAWAKTRTTVSPDAVASPISGYSSDYIVADTSGSALSRDVRQTTTASQASAATFAAIVGMKAGECRYLALNIRDNSNASNNLGAEFDLQSGVISIAASTSGTASSASATIVPFGTFGGVTYYRITVTGIIGGAGSAITCIITGRTTSNSNTVADGLGWYTAAAWLEQGAFPTSLILGDETTTVTRAADNLYVDPTKIPPFGGGFTVVGEAEPSPDTGTQTHEIFELRKDGSNSMRLRNNSAGTKALNMYNIVAGVPVVSIISGNNVAASRFRFAAAFSENSFELVTDGVSRGVDNSGTLPTGITNIYIGKNGGSSYWAAPIGFLALIPERLSQAEMIARTS